MRHILLPAILALTAAPAFADYNMNGKIIDCYCTDSTGGHIDIGETICLHVGGRMFTAQCQMSLNVPMWREISNGCLSSQLRPNALPQSLRDPAINPLAIDAHVAAPKS